MLSFTNTIKNKDEYTYFRNVVNEMKNRNPDALMGIVNGLSETKKLFLKQTISNQRVVTSQNSNKTVTRKVVKVSSKKK